MFVVFDILIFSQINESPTFGAIRDYTQQTASNTSRDEIYWLITSLTLAIAIATLLVSYRTYKSQKQTELNTLRITHDMQKSLLIDTVRHLYRNLVVISAIQIKLEQCEYKAYPSEEHILKLKLPLENIHLEIFNKDEDYMNMYDLYIKFRNFNEEVESVIYHHLKLEHLSIDVKNRDISTIIFKCGYLSRMILYTMEMLWYNDFRYDVVNRLLQTSEDNIKYNIHPDKADKVIDADFDSICHEIIKSFAAQLNVISEVEKLYKNFKYEVYIECGVNAQNSPRIFMINF